MATYNGEKYIETQLRSILSQLSHDDEVIISDDSSIDSTVSRAAAINDPRIIILSEQKFRSPIFNFQNAIQHAKGDYIFLSDQDDVWLDGRVNKMMLMLKDHDLVVSDCSIVDESLKVISASYFRQVNARPGFLKNFLRTSSYIGCCMAFDRKIVELALPFPRTIPMHDFWIAMLAEWRFKIGFVYEPLVLYRRHGGNVSETGGKSKNSLFTKIFLRIRTFRHLVIRILR
ncbi:glycosyltransferase [Chryseolinea lacunae]|uniref:Glycosyltransferase n=1 Tax=Chryseolinea lacunae TaxID=2801331 RepID=A0ABS1KSD6_9BACT|nr:glycosyltransferase [Chryseolinea lacunae]